MGEEGDHREQAQKDRRASPDGQLRPMPLCLEAEALTHFLESGLHLPASYEPRDDPLELGIEIGAKESGAKESLGLELFF